MKSYLKLVDGHWEREEGEGTAAGDWELKATPKGSKNVCWRRLFYQLLLSQGHVQGRCSYVTAAFSVDDY